MSELTKDMILDFFVKKGGVVKNVDLVRHFKKYLQVDDPHLKGTGNVCILFICYVRVYMCLKGHICESVVILSGF